VCACPIDFYCAAIVLSGNRVRESEKEKERDRATGRLKGKAAAGVDGVDVCHKLICMQQRQ